MNTARKLSIPSHVMARQVGDEMVILDLKNGTYFGLDAVGTRIWQLLSEGLSLAEICNTMEVEFDVTINVLQADLQGLLKELEDRGLVVTST